MFITRTLRLTLLGLALFASQVQAQVQDAVPYPTRPLKLVVPLTPGTTTDLVAREFADRMAKKLGQPVVVDNKPGAGGIIAAQTVAKSAPDGYTILLINSQHAINPAAYRYTPAPIKAGARTVSSDVPNRDVNRKIRMELRT